MNISGSENYQSYYLKRAINEILEEYDIDKRDKIVKSIQTRIDHYNGCDYINNKKFPLVFPKYLLQYISTIRKNKNIKYNFIGTITKQRQWLNKYKNNSIIKESNRGRDNKLKYDIDTEYYNIMSRSEFTLTPTGDCPWSYRFFEAIMCHSIPILETNSNDIYCKDYFFYYDNDMHIYDEKQVMNNYNKFIERHFLISNIF